MRLTSAACCERIYKYLLMFDRSKNHQLNTKYYKELSTQIAHAFKLKDILGSQVHFKKK